VLLRDRAEIVVLRVGIKNQQRTRDGGADNAEALGISKDCAGKTDRCDGRQEYLPELHLAESHKQNVGALFVRLVRIHDTPVAFS
jgi:hypothetical protein